MNARQTLTDQRNYIPHTLSWFVCLFRLGRAKAQAVSNSPFSCLSFSTAANTGVYHLSQLINGPRRNVHESEVVHAAL